MLVFGESILNDAISIVLTTTVMPTKTSGDELLNIGRGEAIILALNRFCLMFFASAGIGVVFALISAMLLKYVGEFKSSSYLTSPLTFRSLQTFANIRHWSSLCSWFSLIALTC
jgi:NhaP-type Na+/H+ or K+/H+ antiporter